MKKFAAVICFSFIALGLHSPVFAEDPNLEKAIVTFEEGSYEEIFNEMDGTVTERYDNISAAAVTATAESITDLKTMEGVKHVEEDLLVESKLQQTGWAIPYIQTPLSWESGYTGKGVKVGVIDSGIAPHPDLKVVGGVSIVGYTGSYKDDSGHGTHVAGIIGALDNSIGIKGVSSGAELYAIKVFDRTNTAYLSDVISGIDWAITQKLDIINLSLGAKKGSVAFQDMIKKAYANDILIIAAAGNTGHEDPLGDKVEYPAKYQEVIAVSAVTQTSERAFFSAAGPAVDIAAPGMGIYSTYIGESYTRMNGTSMAAPYVTGQAALLKEAYPALDNSQIRSLLFNNAIDLGAPGWDSVFGHGLIQAQSYLLPEFGQTAKLNPAENLQPETKEIKGAEGVQKNVKVFLGLKKGQKVDVSAAAKWVSANPLIAKVDKGKVSFIGKGITNLQVSYGDFKTEISVTVEEGTTPSGTAFTDVSNKHWAFSEIQKMAERKVINGYPDATFRPEESIKRMNAAAMFSRLLLMTEKTAFKPFSDVPAAHPYYTEIKAVQQSGIFSGNDKGFAPAGELTRAQMAKVLVTAFDLKAEGVHPFADVPSSHWANDYIEVLYATGVTTGSNGAFRPEDKVTRAQFSVFMSRALVWQESLEES